MLGIFQKKNANKARKYGIYRHLPTYEKIIRNLVSFSIKNNEIITPKLTDSVLESITRDTIIKIASNEGYKVTERTIDRTELYTCDEAFLCGSAMEITPVLSIDRYDINDQKEANITKKLHHSYLDIVRGKNSQFTSWLVNIYE